MTSWQYKPGYRSTPYGLAIVILITISVLIWVGIIIGSI